MRERRTAYKRSNAVAANRNRLRFSIDRSALYCSKADWTNEMIPEQKNGNSGDCEYDTAQ
jgi:hypothetical protein